MIGYQSYPFYRSLLKAYNLTTQRTGEVSKATVLEDLSVEEDRSGAANWSWRLGRRMEVSNLLQKLLAAVGLALEGVEASGEEDGETVPAPWSASRDSSSPSTAAMAAFRSTCGEARRTRNVSSSWFNPDIVVWSTTVRSSTSEAAVTEPPREGVSHQDQLKRFSAKREHKQ
jgi:hypothetical protein